VKTTLLAVLLVVGCEDKALDSDGDGITDQWEAVYGTNAQKADTDGDGISDSDEINFGTNPVVADTDGDGMSDGEEQLAGLDPLDPDSDLDGFQDQEEVDLGTNPLDPFSWDYAGDRWCDRRRAAETVYGTGWDLEDIAPNTILFDQFGDEVELYQFYGNVILMDFSAGWCGPCRELAAGAQQLWTEYREEGFMIIHVLTQDNSSAPPDAAFLSGWASEYDLGFPVTRNPNGTAIDGFGDAGLYGGTIPFMALIDTNMVVDSTYVGSAVEESIRTRVAELIAARGGSQ
jgi:thiol-disulfide isomerase/thioredoxin